MEPTQAWRCFGKKRTISKRLILVSQRACLGPLNTRLQSCCANGDVDGWVCTPVITSVACVGVRERVQVQELELELELELETLQACESTSKVDPAKLQDGG